jgi:dihydrofolate synthase/folylpolyglutamate synthase
LEFEKILKKISSMGKINNPGIERITTLLKFLGNPQEKFKAVHVVGTNGKGSVCHTVASILQAAGFKTALFTSPHLITFRERIKINSEIISKYDCAKFSSAIFEVIENNNLRVTKFEFLTALAFYYFSEQNAEIAVVEAGLGGRLDATNVFCSPLVCAITSISFDHTEVLGDTLEKIASEKSGIIKPKSPVVIYPDQSSSVIDIISAKCTTLNCELIIPDKNEIKLTESEIGNCSVFEYDDLEIRSPLLGDHQTQNLITSLNIIEILKRSFNIDKKAIQKGIKNISLHARFEVLNEDPLVIFDGAHNPDGACVLANTMEKYFPSKNPVAVFGVMRDKDISGILSCFNGKFSKIFTAAVKESRAMPVAKLGKMAKKFAKSVKSSKNVKNAIDMALKETRNNNGICLIFGSLHLAKHAMKYFKISDF